MPGRQITALKQQTRNPDRVNVYLDGEFAFGLAKVFALSLRRGQELTEDEVAELEGKDAEEQTYQKALRWLVRRPRSEYELRLRWRRTGVIDSVQESVLARLRRVGQVDDRAFAEAWVENRTTFRPRSARMLRAEMRQKGVPREAIEAALEGFNDQAAAYEAARKAMRRWKHLSQDQFEARLGSYLSRRGFPYSIISPVVAELWSETVGSESEDSK